MKKLLIIVFLSLSTLPAIWHLLLPGFYSMHDDQQVVRLILLDEAVSTGQFPVRWVSDLGFGYGYPLFNFYPPLVYYLGEVFHLLGFGFIWSVKLVLITSFVASALAMYFWTKHHFGVLAGLVGAIFYTYAPYRSVDVYVRGAMAEAFSFVWLPLLFLAIDKTFENQKWANQRGWLLLFAICYAALMLTHNLILLPFTLLVPVYCIFKILSIKKMHDFILSNTKVFTAAIIGLSLSCFFWLPALTEKRFTLVDDILLTEKYAYEQHFVEPTQLWNTLWGYGGSSPDALDGFSLKIGKAHVVASSLSMIMALWFCRKKKLRSKSHIVISLFGMLVVSSVMMLRVSQPIWELMSPLQFLQFPWRFLTFAILFSSFLAGGLTGFISKFLDHVAISVGAYRYNLLHKRLTLLLITIVLLLANLVPHVKLFKPKDSLNVTDDYYSNEEFIKWQISKTSFEFVPIGVATSIDPELKITQLDIDEDAIAIEPYKVVDGQAQVQTLQDTPGFKQFLVNSNDQSMLQINTFNFPGWTVWVNNQKQNIDDSNPLKLITVALPSGESTVKVKFANTPIRAITNLVSLGSLLGIVFWVGFRGKSWLKGT